jgi:hypothetical protein
MVVNNMSTNDYVKYVTQRIVSYMDSPKDQRKSLREEKKQNRTPFLNRWFGIIPFAVMLMFKKNK